MSMTHSSSVWHISTPIQVESVGTELGPWGSSGRIAPQLVLGVGYDCVPLVALAYVQPDELDMCAETDQKGREVLLYREPALMPAVEDVVAYATNPGKLRDVRAPIDSPRIPEER